MQTQAARVRSAVVVLICGALLLLCGTEPVWSQEKPADNPAAEPRPSAADWWDKVFRSKPYRPVQASESFIAHCAQRLLRERLLEPGSKVLVLAMGDGANAVYLAQQGLDVTGMDISPVAVETARKAAAAVGVSIRQVQADLFKYDMGRSQWDLVTNIFFNPAIRVLERLKQSVRPGGLLLIEGYGADYTGPGPAQWSRYRANQLLEGLAGWRILEYQDGMFPAIWAGDKTVPVVRVLARRPDNPSAPQQRLPSD